MGSEIPDTESNPGEVEWGDWIFLPERFAIHKPTNCGLVSDLHLGYFRARNQRGDLVPPVPLSEELEPLLRGLNRHRIDRWCCAGDLFEKGGTRETYLEFSAWEKQTGKELIAIAPGNHDRKGDWEEWNLPWKPGGFGINGWWVHHGDHDIPNLAQQITGHYHPVIPRKKGPRNPCFLLSKSHMVLPAYSREVSGVAAWKRFAGSAWRCIAIGPKNCVDLGTMDQVYQWAHGKLG